MGYTVLVIASALFLLALGFYLKVVVEIFKYLFIDYGRK